MGPGLTEEGKSQAECPAAAFRGNGLSVRVHVVLLFTRVDDCFAGAWASMAIFPGRRSPRLSSNTISFCASLLQLPSSVIT